jgi:hypothetical protein
MVPPVIRINAHQLVAQLIDPAPITSSVVETALAQALRRGFVCNWTPTPEAYRQQMVLVSMRHPIAALYRALAPDGTPTPVPRGLVESRTISPIANVISGMILARFGLVVMQVTGCSVTLRGSSMELANDANISRFQQLPPRPTWRVIERAIGLVKSPAEIDDDLRLRAALIYDAHGLAVEGLLDGDDHSTLVSPWRFPEPQTPRDENALPF